MNILGSLCFMRRGLHTESVGNIQCVAGVCKLKFIGTQICLFVYVWSMVIFRLHRAGKVENIYDLILYRKSLLTYV